jgi:hypothetical protein
MRKMAVFLLSPYAKPGQVFDAWTLEGEEDKKGKINNNLLEFKRKTEAEMILQRKEQHYRKFLKQMDRLN